MKNVVVHLLAWLFFMTVVSLGISCLHYGGYLR
jgi:hypothetical protein